MFFLLGYWLTAWNLDGELAEVVVHVNPVALRKGHRLAIRPGDGHRCRQLEAAASAVDEVRPLPRL